MLNSSTSRAQTGARQPNLEKAHFFATHPDATLALLSVEDLPGGVWEPACGRGDIAEVILRRPEVSSLLATDLVDRGYGTTEDFFEVASLPPGVNHVVTNPPYELAEEFVRHALHLAPPGKVAMLLRTVWLEGQRRRERLWERDPPARVWVFSRRPLFARDGGPWQSGLISFSWFVWDRSHSGPPALGWI
jgi:hypothetical protein